MGSKYFTDEDLVCHCCNQLPPNGMDQNLLDLLDDMQDAVNATLPEGETERLVINDAYRCQEHNDSIPNSVPNSQHVQGCAADINCPACMDVEKLAQIAESLNADGVGRYPGDAGNFCHVDSRSGRVGDTFRW